MKKVSKKAPSGYKYVSCRDIGHAWQWQNDYPLAPIRKNGRNLVERLLYCGACSATRLDTVVFPTMEILHRSYTYPDGYTVPGGRIPSSVFRVQAFAQRMSK